MHSRVADPKMSVMTPDQRRIITDYARQFLGTPYRYGGTSPQNGFDCSGFTSFVLNKFGYSLPRTSGGQSILGRAITFEDAQPGDLLFFGRGKHVEHVALVVKNSRKGLEMVHSSTSSGVRIEDMRQSAYWKKRIMFAIDVASL